MKFRKILAKIKRRQDDYDNNISKQNLPGFHRPGSLKK